MGVPKKLDGLFHGMKMDDNQGYPMSGNLHLGLVYQIGRFFDFPFQTKHLLGGEPHDLEEIHIIPSFVQ